MSGLRGRSRTSTTLEPTSPYDTLLYRFRRAEKQLALSLCVSPGPGFPQTEGRLGFEEENGYQIRTMNKIIFPFCVSILFLTAPVCAKEEQLQGVPFLR